MKKIILILTSLLAIGATAFAGCTMPEKTDADSTKARTGEIVQETEETPDNDEDNNDGNCDDGNCKDGNCEDNCDKPDCRKPRFRKARPAPDNGGDNESTRMISDGEDGENPPPPPRARHRKARKKHGNTTPIPVPNPSTQPQN